MTRSGKRAAVVALATVALAVSHWWRVPSLAAARGVGERDAAARARDRGRRAPGQQTPPARSRSCRPATSPCRSAATRSRWRKRRPIAAGEWQILVYVDGLAAKHDELERAAAALEAAKARLAALGPVTILVADTLVEPWVEDTHRSATSSRARSPSSRSDLRAAELSRRRLRGVAQRDAARADRTALVGQGSASAAGDRGRQRRAVGRRREERGRRLELEAPVASRTRRVGARSRPRLARWVGWRCRSTSAPAAGSRFRRWPRRPVAKRCSMSPR